MSWELHCIRWLECRFQWTWMSPVTRTPSMSLLSIPNRAIKMSRTTPFCSSTSKLILMVPSINNSLKLFIIPRPETNSIHFFFVSVDLKALKFMIKNSQLPSTITKIENMKFMSNKKRPETDEYEIRFNLHLPCWSLTSFFYSWHRINQGNNSWNNFSLCLGVLSAIILNLLLSWRGEEPNRCALMASSEGGECQ